MEGVKKIVNSLATDKYVAITLASFNLYKL